MADSDTREAPKKPSKIPMILWGAATFGLLARTFWHPYRAVVSKGFAQQCPGTVNGACTTGMVIQGADGAAVPVYSLTSGIVSIASDGTIQIVSDREPIIIGYGTNHVQAFVADGDKVPIGKEIAVMSTVNLTVTLVQKNVDGSVSYVPIDPASWLAARGLRIAQSGNTVSGLWCSHGRNITVPTDTLGCGIKLPDPSALMLLPVTVTTQ